MRAKSGFTLVEVLIVLVILGVLAAIVIPQFTEAGTHAKESSLRSDLQMMRSQIELYKIQHNGILPGQGTEGAAFVQCMAGMTDVDGAVASAAGSGVYGPYMRTIPTNPFNDKVTITAAATDPGTAGDAGWFFNTTTGEFRPDDTLSSPDGTAHMDF